MGRKPNIFVRIWNFYIEGFRNMTWGRTLWLVIIIKLCVMFLVLRMFFFKPALSGQSNDQKAETVSGNLIEKGRIVLHL